LHLTIDNLGNRQLAGTTTTTFAATLWLRPAFFVNITDLPSIIITATRRCRSWIRHVGRISRARAPTSGRATGATWASTFLFRPTTWCSGFGARYRFTARGINLLTLNSFSLLQG
jgi:hypothetical protein